MDQTAMIKYRPTRFAVLTLVLLALVAIVVPPAAAEDLIPQDTIKSLNKDLAQAGQATSSARTKLALRRVIREGDRLVESNSNAANRFEVLDVLFRAQRQLIELDDSPRHRAAFLETCRKLAAAPTEYAAIRLDADMLLSQAALAKQGADLRARSEALRPLIERYKGTAVEAKVLRIAMLMALEFGDAAMITHLRQIIAERCPNDIEMIIFLRDKLGGQVFGAPFVGALKAADGSVHRFPMDYLGTTTMLFFWSVQDNGREHVKELAAAWNDNKHNAIGRMTYVSINLDNLPDAGESILREHGADWPALTLPRGRDNPIYRAYARRDPTIITVSPTGYAALFMRGGNSHTHGYERRARSSLARLWVRPRYVSHLQSLLVGEFLIRDPQGRFDPALPPELVAASLNRDADLPKLARTAASVPMDTLQAIEACFIAPPKRYRAAFDQVRAGYEKAVALCTDAIEAHEAAPDLWIVRNRLIVALMGLWKLDLDNAYLDQAAAQARAAIEAGMPEAADTVAQLCLARHALHQPDSDPQAAIHQLADPANVGSLDGPTLAAAALLALEIGDRPLHERCRRALLDGHVDTPLLRPVTAFMLDRYHRYWLYQVPFTAGWTYGRRQSYFMAEGEPEDARRTVQAQLKTLDGNTLRIPQDTSGQWTVIAFVPDAKNAGLPRGSDTFAQARPFDDVQLYTAVFSDDADAVRKTLDDKKRPDPYPTLLVPDATNNPIVKQLSMLSEDQKPNILILRPDGTIARMVSGLTLSIGHRGNIVQNTIEWHDEKAVDQALAKGDLDEAERLALAYAPRKQLPPPNAKKNWKPRPISIPHLRSRAKVYMAKGNWQAALADAEQVYLAVKRRDGWLSMRTPELDNIEKLKAEIISKMK